MIGMSPISRLDCGSTHPTSTIRRISHAPGSGTAFKFWSWPGFRPFDSGAAQWLDKKLEVMVRSQLRPKLIFWRAVDLLALKRIEIPPSFRLTETVLQAALRSISTRSAVVSRKFS